jgi:hypothetical protein
MTVTLSAARLAFVRLSLAASLLGAGLLIASVQPGAAGEIAPIPVSATLSPTPDACPPASGPTAAPAQCAPSQLGSVGFGWG